MDMLFPIHPRFVHFAIALSLVGAGALAFGLFSRRERWLGWGRISVLFGWIGVLVAIITGLMDQSRAPNTSQVTQVVNQHITVGIALLVVLGAALYWPLRDRQLFAAGRRVWGYVALLLLGVALVLLEGWLGGKLVYHFGVGVH